MKIIIEYESSWRNSFLDGSNNEELPKKGRKFIASMTNLKKPENFIQREITIDTVMGVLNRLIGDQRKLYQARRDVDYFFKDYEKYTHFDDKPILTNDMTFIRNITGSNDQNSFTGAIKTNVPMFDSDYSDEFWGVLALDFNDLCDFIISDSRVNQKIATDPISIITQLELLNKEKPVVNDGLASKALQVLKEKFNGINYLNAKDKIVPICFYCSSLYLQLERLSSKFDMSSAKTKIGGISGISKRGFTKKDFMNKFTTGKPKLIFGNPYIREEFVKGEGKIKHLMTKASGKLEITLDIDRNKAKEIRSMIENAGVSSFYLGKKGLAYVSKIRV
ncbi:MAG: hypothetical protein KAH84_03535 [Thiomargarita sp.]|nr:hypothetical protein [Thiomargarita sp.]